MAKHNFWSFVLFTAGLVLTTDISFGHKRLAEGASNKGEKDLVEHVLKSTNANVRPVINHSEAVNVTLDITFHGVIEMDEKFQILTSSVWVRQEWTNQLIKWNPADYGGVKHIALDSSQIWQPDIVLYNNVFEEFDGRMDNVKTLIRVRYDGYCYWAAPFIFKTSCHFDVRDFPFDNQQCMLKFGSWLFHTGQLDLIRKRDLAPIAIEKVDNGEWNVTSIDINKNVIVYACCPNETYPDITFVIHLKRRSLYYTFNLIIPNFLIALLAFFSFYIPVECGERLSFVITVLLSMTVFLLLVAESIPPTSEAVPVIGMYYTSSIIEVALALVATGISLKVYYSYLYGKGLSPRLRKFLFHRLAPVLCFNIEIIEGTDRNKNKPYNPFSFLKSLKQRPKRDSDVSMYSVTENQAKLGNGVNNSTKTEPKLLSVDVRATAGSDTGLSDSKGELSGQEVRHRFKKDCVASELQTISSAVKDQKDSEKQAAECRIAAAIVDRAFMVLFVVVFFVSTLVILLLPFIRKR
ncbi:neuronal acetylcholine receptor subunit alpha-10-like isoform X2 [Oculina patagonica]